MTSLPERVLAALARVDVYSISSKSLNNVERLPGSRMVLLRPARGDVTATLERCTRLGYTVVGVSDLPGAMTLLAQDRVDLVVALDAEDVFPQLRILDVQPIPRASTSEPDASGPRKRPTLTR